MSLTAPTCIFASDPSFRNASPDCKPQVGAVPVPVPVPFNVFVALAGPLLSSIFFPREGCDPTAAHYYNQ